MCLRKGMKRGIGNSSRLLLAELRISGWTWISKLCRYCKRHCLLYKVLGSVEDDLIKRKDDDIVAKLGGSTFIKSNNRNKEDDWDDFNLEAISNFVVKRWSLGSQFSCLPLCYLQMNQIGNSKYDAGTKEW